MIVLIPGAASSASSSPTPHLSFSHRPAPRGRCAVVRVSHHGVHVPFLRSNHLARHDPLAGSYLALPRFPAAVTQTAGIAVARLTVLTAGFQNCCRQVKAVRVLLSQRNLPLKNKGVTWCTSGGGMLTPSASRGRYAGVRGTFCASRGQCRAYDNADSGHTAASWFVLAVGVFPA